MKLTDVYDIPFTSISSVNEFINYGVGSQCIRSK
jgi:hypothetical protein